MLPVDEAARAVYARLEVRLTSPSTLANGEKEKSGWDRL